MSFASCTRYSGTKGVMKHFDLMRSRTLRMHNLEKLFAAKRVRLDQYATTSNVSSNIFIPMLLTHTYIPSMSHNVQHLVHAGEIYSYFCIYC